MSKINFIKKNGRVIISDSEGTKYTIASDAILGISHRFKNKFFVPISKTEDLEISYLDVENPLDTHEFENRNELIEILTTYFFNSDTSTLQSIDGKLPALELGRMPVSVGSLNVTLADASIEVSNTALNPVPTEDANIDIAISALRDALLGTESKTNTHIATALAEILAKIILAPATEAKQDTANTSLASVKTNTDKLDITLTALATSIKDGKTLADINTILTTISGKDFATQVTAAAILAILGNGLQKTQIASATDIAAIVTGPNTSVKGLRVYGGPTDPISDIPVTIEYGHHQIHEGEAYLWLFYGAVNATTKNIRISVPVLAATTRTPHLLFEIVSDNTTCISTLYEGTTWTNNQAGQDDSSNILNRNRNSANAAATKIYVAGTPVLTPSSLGTKLDVQYVSPNKNVGNPDRTVNEWDLKSTTEYLLQVITTGNGNCLIKLNFYEDLGV